MQYYIGGVDIKSSITGASDTTLDQGVWQRTLNVVDSDRDALISAQMRRDWPPIAKFLQFYLKKQGDRQHWRAFVDLADGTVHVHFNKTSMAADAPSNAGLASATGCGGLHNTVFQYSGLSYQYDSTSAASSPVTVSCCRTLARTW